MQTNVPETQGVIFFQQIQNKKLTAFRWKGSTKQRKRILFEGLLFSCDFSMNCGSRSDSLPALPQKIASLVKNNADAARVPSILRN